jgi:glycosyltransferase involved in cell wall biosynthesis
MQLISVIIPTYNDPDGISITIKSLINQNYQDSYEVIVVDNNSNDNTRGVVKALIKNNPNKYCKLNLYNQDKIRTSYATRNLGIRKSKGDILCFIDSDMWVDNDYLTKVVQAYQSKTEECFYMGCNVEIVMKKRSIFEKYDKLTGFPMEKYLMKSHFVGGGCLVVNRKTFNKVGLFNQELYSGGDFEFGQRVYKAEVSQIFSKKIRLYHPARNLITSHIQKQKRVIRGLIDLEGKRLTMVIKLILPPNPIIHFTECSKIKESLRPLDYFTLYLIRSLLKIVKLSQYIL